MIEPVGDELAKLIPDWAIKDQAGCDCNAWRKQTNRRRVTGCLRNKDKIIKHLLDSSEHLIPIIAMMPKPLQRMGAKRLLTKAITNAEHRR